MNAVEIRHLIKRFGGFTALDSLDLVVPQGIVFGFLGPNGAGKTTTLRIMTGLARATSGEVRIAGTVGFLPDTPSFYNWMSAPEFLAYIAQIHDIPSPPIAETLERVGLKDAKKRKIGGFSRGMKQRLGLAQALLPRPSVLLLDEPVSALDPAGRKDVLDIMAGLRGEMTVFFSTHILNDAERICDEVAILDKGRLRAQFNRDAMLREFVRPIFEIDAMPDAAPQIAQLGQDLSALPWVEHLSNHHAWLRVHVTDVEIARRELMPRLSGIPVTRVELVGATLEDVFLTLTGPQEGDVS